MPFTKSGVLNYITTVWDLCHRDDPEFPEVRWYRQFETRELYYSKVLPRASAIFVDSEVGKANTSRRYGVDEDKIYVMPFQPAVATRRDQESTQICKLDVPQTFKLDLPYIFYPHSLAAQEPCLSTRRIAYIRRDKWYPRWCNF